ncbi:MAG: SDR family oxidoreductase [Alphaproteobacteria bacterium]|nr:MAG: SDR family oxidoreductase [Alphaproteobacteria bacterium]
MSKDQSILPLSAESRGEAPGRGRLHGRRILIVGGGQRSCDPETDPVGNGRAMSMLFAREGAHVAVADAKLESAEDTVELIEKDGGNAFAIQGDVGKEEDIQAMIARAVSEMGGLDGVVYNVGIAGQTGIDVAVDEWDRIIDVNLRGAMLVGREALNVMEPGGSIVLISSIAGLTSGSQIVAYDTSKAALGGLMRYLARLGARKNVRANVVAPGLVDTPLGRLAIRGRPSRGAGENTPFGRQATGWEIAYAALFFMSDESVYVTSQILAVDSGLTGM